MGKGTYKLRFHVTYSWADKTILWAEVGSVS